MTNKTKPRMHSARHVFRFSSKKNNGVNVLESYLELTYALMFSCDPNIKSFGSQTESMHCDYNGKRCRYTPDFLVSYIDGTFEFIEVHPTEFITEEFRQRLDHFNEYSVAESGIPIVLKTDEGLHRMLRVNYQLIASECDIFLNDNISIPDLPLSITLSGLIDHVSTFNNRPIAQAYTIVGQGHYEFDMTKLLSADTQLSKN
ncbi:hypothetical protein Q4591_12785 [Shewanella sp. 3_MG-2023]|uniref:TnsA endonuclease N-terminal domain-containing protein n=1 Tax=Shewanella sp. 3_MG-2023 TaxID=3062635 RepID=UPI0026E2565F|nr:TnsA endonuclease N-terminal domain-containing protein [Shewanella sp. 3_MG-2023]MDO6776234.1 hypothetical protein [Shewanella sp. 3_MG-2023]